MDLYYSVRTNRYVCALFIIIFIHISNMSGIYSQNIDPLKGPVIHNGKEPPDIPDVAPIQETFQSEKDRNIERGGLRFNKRPMKFMCSSRVPMFVSRRNIPAQTTDSPFIITVTPEETKNKFLHVKINSSEGQTFRGFMIQILSSGTEADDIIVGKFLPSPDVNLQSCYARDDTAISDDKKKKLSATVTWRAPADLKNNILVRVTIVQDYQTYWLDILTEEINLGDLSTDTADQASTNNTSADGKTVSNSTSKSDDSLKTLGDDTVDLDIPNNLDDNEEKDLEKSIAETFEDFSGPLESPDEVLIHQGIREVNKVDNSRDQMPDQSDQPGIVIKAPSFDDAPTAPLPPPRYIYRIMNQFAPDFEPPQAAEFVGDLLKGALLGGSGRPASGGGGGLGSMMNMMGMASSMLGGGRNQGGGGGLMSSLGTMSKLSNMLGGGMRGTQAPAVRSPMGGMGSLGALSSLGSMLGGGGGSPLGALLGGSRGGGNPAPTPSRSSGLGGLGGLSSLLGGLGKGSTPQGPPTNAPPPPSGAPVNPIRRDEPSLADLLGVDPAVALDSTPTVVPAEANPIAGVSAAKAGGGLMAKIGGFAPMLAMAPIAFSMFGSKKKKQQQMPFGQGQFGPPGMPGMPGMPPGAPGQFGMPGGAPGQFGMPGAPQGQFGMPGQGQFGMQQGQQGQFGAMPGQFGAPQQNTGFFGQAQPPTTAAPKSNEIQQIIQMLEAQRLQIELLKNQISGSSITSQMGGFGNIPLSLGQTTSSQLLGLSDPNRLSNFGTTLSTFEPVGPPKQVTQPPQSSSGQDALLQQLLQQNQMLMQQNQQFQNNMLAATQSQNQFGSPAGNAIGRVNRSNGPMGNNVVTSNTFGQSNVPQSVNTGVANGFLPGSGNAGAFQNTVGPGTFGASSQGGFGGMPGNLGRQGMPNPTQPASSMFGQFGGSNNGAAAGGGITNFGGANGGTTGNQGGPPSGGSLASMFGGGPASGIRPPPGMQGGSSDTGGQGNAQSHQGGPPTGGGSGPSNNMPDLGSLMGNLDTSALQGMLGGGGGPGGMDMSSLLGSVDVNAMQGLLSGEQGQDLMKSVSGMLSGPNGGNLMQAVSGMMSGNGGPADVASLMGSMDIGELQNMAQQAESIMASSGIDPAQILGMMG